MEGPTIVTGCYVAPKYTHCNTQHIAIVVFRHKSLSMEGSVSEYLQAHLKSWFLHIATMHFIDIPFDLDPMDEQGLEHHAKAVHRKLAQVVK